VPSAMGTWIQAIVRALDGHGINGTNLALQAGVSPRVLRSADERAPQPAANRLWALAVEATGDPCFGLQVARFTTPVTFHALGYAVLASRDIKAVFQRVIRFQRLITETTNERLELGGDRYRFIVERVSPLGPPPEAIDAFFATGVRTLRWLTTPAPVNPLAVHLQRAEPMPSDLYRKIFRCPVAFGAPLDLMEFSRKDVEAPLPNANAELARQNDAIVGDYLARSGRSGSVADRVHALVVGHLPDGGPAEASIAQRLCMTPRNLQLQLAREGTSYKAVLNRVREDLASNYLQQGKFTIKEISFLLGFSDPATFTRAFRRWTGQSPRHFAKKAAG
jgi:AraC-like DNA-binding protein